MTTLKRYRDAEKELQIAQVNLKQFMARDINVTDIESVKRLQFLADCVISREAIANLVWNHLTEAQMDKIISEKSTYQY